jgi:hypothetical protein
VYASANDGTVFTFKVGSSKVLCTVQIIQIITSSFLLNMLQRFCGELIYASSSTLLQPSVAAAASAVATSATISTMLWTPHVLLSCCVCECVLLKSTIQTV